MRQAFPLIGFASQDMMRKGPVSEIYPFETGPFLFPDKGSNLDIQIQNLTYYHYTIREWDGKNKKFMASFQHP